MRNFSIFAIFQSLAPLLYENIFSGVEYNKTYNNYFKYSGKNFSSQINNLHKALCGYFQMNATVCEVGDYCR